MVCQYTIDEENPAHTLARAERVAKNRAALAKRPMALLQVGGAIRVIEEWRLGQRPAMMVVKPPSLRPRYATIEEARAVAQARRQAAIENDRGSQRFGIRNRHDGFDVVLVVKTNRAEMLEIV
jgi:hypothetical protein